MGSEFLVYLRLGFEHIADVRGYDHILFIVALTAMYPPREWLRVVVLVTAFTVGHTVTLALATLELVRISTALVEFLIPVTIIAAAALNAVEVEWGRRRDGVATPRRPSATRWRSSHGVGSSPSTPWRSGSG
ncbi:MAG: HupE/UreJ family protein [Longimicrobiales bacterium]